MNTKAGIPVRSEIATADTWDLTVLFPDEQEWEKGLAEIQAGLPKIEALRGTLARSVDALKSALDALTALELLVERVGTYAQLKQSEDQGDSLNQARSSRYLSAASQFAAAASFVSPEILAIPEETMTRYLAADTLAGYRVFLGKLLRFREHTLEANEERLLALQMESSQAVEKAYSVLLNVDLDYGSVETKDGPTPLTQTTYIGLLQNPDRGVREKAYRGFMRSFDAHKNTLAALLEGRVLQDLYQAQAHRFDTVLASRLFGDAVDPAVYANLITTVTEGLPALHEYYGLRKHVLGVDALRHYDVRVPLVADLERTTTYDEAVELICRALKPLGAEYGETLRAGLSGRWVDRYENKGKRSGAFSSGSYAGLPYILMNYKNDNFDHVFTLAHEAGHSMHSWYSVRNNPFVHYRYSTFEAEVASTFNERLLGTLLSDECRDDDLKAWLINKEIDEIVGTLYRQTMFAEFELAIHTMAERREPLTLQALRTEYGRLLRKYFGPELAFEDSSDLEFLRIPHFYSAFYVYMYATGISAAIALSRRVLGGGPTERDEYLSFLKSGGSRFPLESLQSAGVDLGRPDPIRSATDRFAELVADLKRVLRP